MILIITGQNGYSPEQVADRAMTVEDLIGDLMEALESGDAKATDRVVVGGYGRGAVWEPAQRLQFPETEDQ